MKKQKRLTARQRAAKAAVRVLGWEKKAFDRAADGVGKVVERTDKLLLKSVDHVKWLPKEGKQVVSEWVHAMKRSRHDVRKTVDTTFDLSTEFCKRMAEPKAVEKPKKQAPAVRQKKAVPTAAA
ncbi:MAG: hypothetical protein AMXMBFR4_31610 [Candidatus Hydrogenedentota bacterium]